MYLFENSISNKQMFVKRMFANACLKKYLTKRTLVLIIKIEHMFIGVMC